MPEQENYIVDAHIVVAAETAEQAEERVSDALERAVDGWQTVTVDDAVALGTQPDPPPVYGYPGAAAPVEATPTERYEQLRDDAAAVVELLAAAKPGRPERAHLAAVAHAAAYRERTALFAIDVLASQQATILPDDLRAASVDMIRRGVEENLDAAWRAEQAGGEAPSGYGPQQPSPEKLWTPRGDDEAAEPEPEPEPERQDVSAERIRFMEDFVYAQLTDADARDRFWTGVASLRERADA